VSSRGEGLRRTEREILAEKASALGRAGERLEAALAELRAVADALAAADDESRRESLRAVYRAARARAGTARLHLLIQREAVGLRAHRVVDQQFPEPAPPPWL
jgi:hypothetical protein